MKKLTAILLLICTLTYGQSPAGLWASGYFGSGIDTSGIWVSTTGLTANSGTYSFPKALPSEAVAIASPTDVINVRGGVYYDSFTISTDSLNIRAYNGEEVVITGFSSVGSWFIPGGTTDTYRTQNTETSLASADVVLINDKMAWYARTPNTGYYTISAFSTNQWAKIPGFSGFSPSINSRIVTKSNKYTFSDGSVTSVSNDTVYTGGISNWFASNFGAFIDNDSTSLDQNYEYYYNPNDNYTYFYFDNTFWTTQLDSVKIASYDVLVTLNNVTGVTLNGITFEGANKNCLDIRRSPYTTVANCNFRYSFNAIEGKNWQDNNPIRSFGCEFYNLYIHDIHNAGINLYEEFGNPIIRNIDMDNVGLIAGMGDIGNGQYTGIRLASDTALVEYFDINKTGYHAISASKEYDTIRYGISDSALLTMDDGAAFYTGGDGENGRYFGHLIATNVIGNSDGTSISEQAAFGVYLDETANGVTVENVTVVNATLGALKFHKAYNPIIRNNTFYGGERGYSNEAYQTSVVYGLNSDSNLIVTLPDKYAWFSYFYTSGIASVGDINNDIYAHWVNNSDSLFRYQEPSPVIRTNLSGWETKTGNVGKNSETTYDNESDLRIDINPTNSSTTVVFSVDRKDFKGNLYSTGSVEIPAWGSLITIPQ